MGKSEHQAAKMVRRSEVVICTRHRSSDVARALRAVARQSAVLGRVLVVDSSDDHATESVVEELDPIFTCDVEYVRAAPGLTHQRNVALQRLRTETEFVHFIDDDAEPDAGYVDAIEAVFDSHPHAAGVSGRISNLPAFRPKRLYQVLGLEGPEGSLLKSGFNMQNFEGSSVRATQWLTGCSMSYRRSAIEGMAFDERRTGGGTGEDVDFSARVAMRGGDLLWAPDALIAHHSSPINRDVSAIWYRRLVLHRWWLAKDGVGPVTRGRVILATLIIIAMLWIKAGTSRSREAAASAWQMSLGLLDIVLRRELS